MTFHLLSLTLAGILCIADFVTEHAIAHKIKKNYKLISFSAGVAISYIILSLFPEISEYALIYSRNIFLYALLGFVSLNLVEQYVYKSNAKNQSISHKTVHVAYFFVYNFFIGAILAIFASKGLAKALLFFIPFLLYIIVEILPQEFQFKKNLSKVIYSSAPLFGALAAIRYIDIISSIFGELLSFITGTLLYIVIRESLPSEKTEKPFYFIIGVLFYTAIFLISWNLI